MPLVLLEEPVTELLVLTLDPVAVLLPVPAVREVELGVVVVLPEGMRDLLLPPRVLLPGAVRTPPVVPMVPPLNEEGSVVARGP